MSSFRYKSDDPLDELAILRARIAQLEHAEAVRLETESALRESRARLRTVVSNAPIVLFALDKQGVFTVSEGKGLESIGYKPGEAVGQSVFEIYKDNPQLSEACRRAMRGEVFTTIAHVPNAIFETRYTPMLDSAGEVIGCIGVATDITQRMRVQENLRQSEERFRLLAENIPGVIYLCRNDERFTMTYLNDAVERLTGHSKERFLADEVSFANLIHPEDLPNVYAGVDEAVSQHSTFHLIYRLRRASGELIWAEEHGAGVFVDGRLEFLEGYITDITQRVAAEQALAKSNEALEQRVAERTEHLRHANDKNLKTQEELAHVLRVATVGELASGLAHEINTPLSVISNYIHGARLRMDSGMLSSRQFLDVLDRIGAQSERAANILKTVRQYITRRGSPGHSNCDLNAIVLEAVALAQLDIKEQQVQVQLHLDDALPPVDGDCVQLQQVILNLMRNGIEAMQSVPAEHRVLSIASRMHEKHTVEINIRDHGPGLSPQIRERIFEPFQTTKPDGLGMGLSISRSIIESHQGKIWVTDPTDEHPDEPPRESPHDAGSKIPATGASFHFTVGARRSST